MTHIVMAFVSASFIYLSFCEASQENLRGERQHLGRRASLYCKNDNYFGFVSDGIDGIASGYEMHQKIKGRKSAEPKSLLWRCHCFATSVAESIHRSIDLQSIPNIL